jgi:hypothetical protein
LCTMVRMLLVRVVLWRLCPPASHIHSWLSDKQTQTSAQPRATGSPLANPTPPVRSPARFSAKRGHGTALPGRSASRARCDRRHSEAGGMC